jgi:hypothetical protein
MTRMSISVAVVATFYMISSANSVSASPQVEWFQFGPTDAVDVVTISYGSYQNLGVYAGQYGGTIAPTQPGLGSPSAQHFYTFCVDLNDEVSVGQYYEVTPTSTNLGLVGGTAIAYLYNKYGINLIDGSDVNGSGLDAADYAAALQLAIWDELANNGQAPSLGSPLQYSGLNPGVADQVQAFLNEAATVLAANGQWLDPHVSQPDNLAVGQAFLDPTPEPSSLVLLVAACCCFAAGQFRRKLAAIGN